MSTSASFEQEIKQFLHKHGTRYADQTSAYYDADFALLLPDGARFALEVKEKRRSYTASAWPAFAPEPQLFILDDLTVRKCLAHAPRSGIAIKDGPGRRYLFFSIVDLALMPRQRVNRAIKKTTSEQKGKWLIDLRNGRQAKSLDELMAHVQNYLEHLHTILFETLPCYGDYVDEIVGQGGTTRQPGHWERDVRETR